MHCLYVCLRVYVSVCVEEERERVGQLTCLYLSFFVPFCSLPHLPHFSLFLSLSSLPSSFLPYLYSPHLVHLGPAFLLFSTLSFTFHSFFTFIRHGVLHCKVANSVTVNYVLLQRFYFTSASTRTLTFTSTPPASINTKQLRTHAHSSHRISQFERYLDPVDGQTISLKEFKDLCFGGK